jgi:hypothetical protein
MCQESCRHVNLPGSHSSKDYLARDRITFAIDQRDKIMFGQFIHRHVNTFSKAFSPPQDIHILRLDKRLFIVLTASLSLKAWPPLPSRSTISFA